MSTEIDDNIVSMKFDNAAFERRMGETIKSLDKLRQSLDLSNASKGIEGVNSAAKNLSLGHIAESVEGIAGKFKALSIVGVAALGAIAVKAVTAAGRMVSSFTFKPIMAGFQEFETNMNSVQTIMSNTESEGAKLKDVNGALDKLNTYSDQTIYNFSQMARNVGTFTAAGVNLKDSVSAIKGIANLAAISGSNSEQASTAMYQLSQALAAGKVNLMDWNSVVNAGMGGKVFKNALFETGKAMGTITDVPVGASFDEWEKKGGTFREQMQKGWLTADVLKTTLGAMSGDLNKSALMTQGFGEEAANQLVKLGKSGMSAAQDIKTFTQLMGTVKEAVGSGWSMTFRTVIGDFEQGKKLWTEVGNAIGGVVKKSADARNNLLKGWAKLGGRTKLIDAFRTAIEAVADVLRFVKLGFRTVFPPMTSKRLFELTKGFAEFTKKLTPSIETLVKLRKISEGFFSIFKIGAEIIKQLFKQVLGPLFSKLDGAGGSFLSAGMKAGIFLSHLRMMLVEGGGIKRFFQNIGKALAGVIHFFSDVGEGIEKVRNKFVGFFKDSEALHAIGERVGQRFGMIGRALSKLGDALQWVSDKFQGVRKVMSKIWEFIKDFFSNLGESIRATMKPGDFDPAVDLLNVGLLGGIMLILRKLSKGFKLFFSGEIGKDAKGFIGKIAGTFDQLTGTLKAMQTEIKSRALLNIAIAVGILAASMTVLSLIDSAALTKALLAISVSFGQLIAAMTLLDKLSFAKSSVKITAIAASMILLATASLILSVAIKNLSSLGWEELAKGLLGTAAGLAAMTASTQLIASDTSGLIRAGIAMIGISIAMLILSKAVKSFAQMSWGDLAKGLGAVAVALLAVSGITKMVNPAAMLAAGVAMIPMAVGLLIMAKAVQSFAKMSWGELAKGMVGVAAGLAIIALTVSNMPPTLPLMAVGLIGVGVALLIIAKAVEKMGGIGILQMAKGIGAIALVLGILAIALNVMAGAIPGAIALGIAAVSLMVLAKVIQTLGGMKISDLVKGIVAMAAAISIIAGLAVGLQVAIPYILGLGIALAVVGVAFALFGVGAMLTVKAMEILAKSGIASIKLLVAALPELAFAFIKSLTKIAEDVLNAAPLFVKLITALLSALLDTIIKLVPKIGEAISVIIDVAIKLITEKFPKILFLGFNLLGQLLIGIRNRIPEFTQTVIDIIVRMINTIANNYQKIVNAGVNLVLKLLTGIANRYPDIVTAGAMILLKLILGIANNLVKILNLAGDIVAALIRGIGNNIQKIVNAGVDIVVKFITGIGNGLSRIGHAIWNPEGTGLINKIVYWVGYYTPKLVTAAFDMVIGMLTGISEAINKNASRLGEAMAGLAEAFAGGIGKALKAAIKKIVDDILPPGMQQVADKVLGIFGISSPSKFFGYVGKMMMLGLSNGISQNFDKPTEAAQAGSKMMVEKLSDSVKRASRAVSLDMDMSPVITPILDLTEVRSGAKSIDKLMSDSPILPVASLIQARVISTATEAERNNTLDEPGPTGPAEVTFIQNNHSPKALSANEIYKKTRSQITLAKEKLEIPS